MKSQDPFSNVNNQLMPSNGSLLGQSKQSYSAFEDPNIEVEDQDEAD